MTWRVKPIYESQKKKRRKKMTRAYLVSLAAVLLISLVSLSCSLWKTPFTQPAWSNTFGGPGEDYGLSVQQTSDGGYIIAGSTEFYGAGSRDVWLIKTDSSGNETWNKTFGGPADDRGYSVGQTSDGGYIITGYTWSYGAGNEDVWLIKADSSGDLSWNRTFGGSSVDHGNSVQQTLDGGYIIAGWTYSYGAGRDDVWLIKTDSSGDLSWNKTFGGSDSDFGSSVQQTSDGGYIIVGSTNSYGAGDDDVWLIKTDSSGDLSWSKTFGGSDADGGTSIQQTSDGGYTIIGDTFSYGNGNRDAWLIKTDSSGNRAWDKTFGSSGVDYGNWAQQTPGGGYIICGSHGDSTDRDGSSYDVRLMKTDSLGNETWGGYFGGSDFDWGNSLQQTSDGGYVVAGFTRSYGAGSYDIWLIKVTAPPEP
jgi:hypothetical protein